MATKVWKGYYEQYGQRQEIVIPYFAAAPCMSIQGSGRDHVGTYEIAGHVAKNLDVAFTKTYHNQQSVKFYGRFNKGDHIDGTWEIPGKTTGKFHLEPDCGLKTSWGPGGFNPQANQSQQQGTGPTPSWNQGGQSQWGLTTTH